MQFCQCMEAGVRVESRVSRAIPHPLLLQYTILAVVMP